jgi:hypothetical protein
MSRTAMGTYDEEGPLRGRLERLRSRLERQGGPIRLGEPEEMPPAYEGAHVVITITAGQGGSRVTGMGRSHEVALFDALVRLRAARRAVLGRGLDDVDPATGHHERS